MARRIHEAGSHKSVVREQESLASFFQFGKERVAHGNLASALRGLGTPYRRTRGNLSHKFAADVPVADASANPSVERLAGTLIPNCRPEMAVGDPGPGPLVNQKLLIDHTFDSELEPVIAR